MDPRTRDEILTIMEADKWNIATKSADGSLTFNKFENKQELKLTIWFSERGFTIIRYYKSCDLDDLKRILMTATPRL